MSIDIESAKIHEIQRLKNQLATKDAEIARLTGELAAAREVVGKHASDVFTLEERRIVCMMEHDIHKYGELQCDYNGWMRDLGERREAALNSAKGEVGNG